MTITTSTLVADVATASPATIKVFQRHRIDFCCGGRVPWARSARRRTWLSPTLRVLPSRTGGHATSARSARRRMRLSRSIVRFIESTISMPELRVELPRLGQMAAKVLSVHGERHPEVLPELEATFPGLLREELEMHMMKEERILFPYIERLEEMSERGRRRFPLHRSARSRRRSGPWRARS